MVEDKSIRAGFVSKVLLEAGTSRSVGVRWTVAVGLTSSISGAEGSERKYLQPASSPRRRLAPAARPFPALCNPSTRLLSRHKLPKLALERVAKC